MSECILVIGMAGQVHYPGLAFSIALLTKRNHPCSSSEKRRELALGFNDFAQDEHRGSCTDTQLIQVMPREFCVHLDLKKLTTTCLRSPQNTHIHERTL